jgi:hypothetical protein
MCLAMSYKVISSNFADKGLDDSVPDDFLFSIVLHVSFIVIHIFLFRLVKSLYDALKSLEIDANGCETSPCDYQSRTEYQCTKLNNGYEIPSTLNCYAEKLSKAEKSNVKQRKLPEINDDEVDDTYECLEMKKENDYDKGL